MQMYKGLPIITNKIPDTERNGIPHHLIDFIGLDEEPWTVGHFVNEAQKVVREIRSRGRLPILVGGTHYYTQSLLFKDSLIADRPNGKGSNSEQMKEEWPILSAATERMYAKLQELDPVIARRWHPKDRRHIRRCLEICLQTGRKASEVYQEQEEQKRSALGEQEEVEGRLEKCVGQTEYLRYASVIFWLQAQDEILKARLNSRVDTMVEDGLLEEASGMSSYSVEMTSKGSALDLDKGIWVSIGYKEMQPYIAAQQSVNRSHEELTRVRAECIEAVKAGTRQYARRQARRIRLTLADVLVKASSLDKMFLLDCTDLGRWKEMVSEPSERITDAFLTGALLPEPSRLSSLAESILASVSKTSSKPQFVARRCADCGKVMMSEDEWTRHLKSSGHKKALEGQRRRAESEKRRQASAAARLDAAGYDMPPHNG